MRTSCQRRVGRSAWGALALPAALVLAGLLLYGNSAPPDNGGGDVDPQRVIGSYTLLIGALWTSLIAVMRRERQQAARRHRQPDLMARVRGTARRSTPARTTTRRAIHVRERL